MRYLLLASEPEAPQHHTDSWAAHVEAAVAFCARLEDELAASSELEWSEVHAPAEHARSDAPDGSVAEGAAGAPALTRLWAIRVADAARAQELAARIAHELAARVELRECLAGAQRP